jgi:Domain of unknown function (DUF5658)
MMRHPSGRRVSSVSGLTGAIAFVAALGVSPLVTQAFAQEIAPRPNLSPALYLPASTPRVSAARIQDRVADVRHPSRSPLMMSLYASTALTQALDAHSTMRALDAGAVEVNPVMSYFSRHRPAFVGMKAGAAAGMVYVGHRLAKRSKTRAAITLIAINSAYAAIVAHNYRVANSLDR